MSQSTEQTPEQIAEQRASYFDLLVRAPQGFILMRAHGGEWRAMTAWGAAEASSLEKVLLLAEHRGLLEMR